MKKLILIYFRSVIVIATIYLVIGCSKQTEWLGTKPNKNSVVPETLKDFQALLGNTNDMNRFFPNAGSAGSDNYFINDNDLLARAEWERNIYSWNEDIVWPNGSTTTWNGPFSIIGRANVVLDGLSTLDADQPEYNNIKGQALFFRAYGYYYLAQIFCKPYDANTAATDLGLPIRLTSDVNIIVQRSTLQQLYDHIIEDATTARDLLDKEPKYIQRPSKIAAMALLAKIHLVMGRYEEARTFANDAIAEKPQLIDFNDPAQVSHTYTYKFPNNGVNNPEIIFYAYSANVPYATVALGGPGQPSPELLNLYKTGDLRQEYFFGTSANRINYVGSYAGRFDPFTGLATNELYLIRSECNARLNNPGGALSDLNLLLSKRYQVGSFIPVSENDADELLRIILEERRKELPNVGNIRWEDLRRLNKDSRFQVTLTRTIAGVTHTLPPNDFRYVFLIPRNEIELSGIEQNER